MIQPYSKTRAAPLPHETYQEHAKVHEQGQDDSDEAQADLEEDEEAARLSREPPAVIVFVVLVEEHRVSPHEVMLPSMLNIGTTNVIALSIAASTTGTHFPTNSKTVRTPKTAMAGQLATTFSTQPSIASSSGSDFSMMPTMKRVKNGPTPVFPESVRERADVETYWRAPIASLLLVDRFDMVGELTAAASNQAPKVNPSRQGQWPEVAML
ncbi:hypothetical protein ACHAWF_017423, partial [Thalassiosira exigua]